MVVSQNKQKLIVKVAGVDPHFSITWVSSVPANYYDSLLFRYIEFDYTTKIVQNVDISKINLEVSDRKFVLMQERTIHNSDGPRFHRVVNW